MALKPFESGASYASVNEMIESRSVELDESVEPHLTIAPFEIQWPEVRDHGIPVN